MNQNINHFLYYPKINNLTLFENPDKWNVTGQEAARYLKEHVIISFESDVPPILDLFDKGGKHQGKGFFAMLRVMFPYLSWAATLFSSKGSEAKKVSNFLNRYCDNKYAKYGEKLYLIYRHGLMHKHFPQLLIESDKWTVYNWEITLISEDHLRAKKGINQCRDTSRPVRVLCIPICPRELYQDILGSLREFAQSLEKGEGVKNFCNGFRSK